MPRLNPFPADADFAAFARHRAKIGEHRKLAADARQRARYDFEAYEEARQHEAEAERLEAELDAVGRGRRRNPETWLSSELEDDSLPEGVPSPAERMLEPAFRAWFKGSKVVDTRGLPLVVWHANNAWWPKGKPTITGRVPDWVVEPFNTFDFDRVLDVGMHFGTLQAARNIGAARPFYLSIENPVTMPDMEAWVGGWPHASSTVEELLIRKLITRQQFEQHMDDLKVLRGDLESWYASGKAVDAFADRRADTAKDLWRVGASRLIRGMLMANGYDGIVYENDFEDEGSLSWIAFDPGQIKSAVENDGSWNFSDLDVRRNPGRRVGRARR